MNEETDFAVFFDRIRSFVGWTDSDAGLVARAWIRVEPAVPAAIDDFYKNIQKHPFTDSVLTGGERQVERLKRTLVEWLKSLFSGEYGLEFAWSRWRVGRRHVEIGLNQSYALGALARLRLHINRAIQLPVPGLPECPPECLLAVNKLLDIDSAIIQFAYQEHYRRSLDQVAAEKLRHIQRLASIGQMVTGLAHESRNALQRSGACLEALLLEIENMPEAQRQAERIQNALDHLNVLYEEVRNYAAPIRLDLEHVRLDWAVEKAWQNLRPVWEPFRTRFSVERPESKRPVVQADGHRMEQVLGNLLQNSIQASGESGLIHCKLECNPEGSQWMLHIDDNGPGIPDGIAHRIFEPFYTTKSKGTGLGLAITRRIVEAHGGEIVASRGENGGARFTLLLPVLQPNPQERTGEPSNQPSPSVWQQD